MTAAPIALMVLLCLLVQGFFSGSGAALSRADRALLRARADDGHPASAVASTLLEREDRLLGTCIVGSTVALVAGATLVASLLRAGGEPPTWLGPAVFAPLALTFGEALPRMIYARHADTLAPRLARPLAAAQLLFAPALLLLGGGADLLRRLGGAPVRDVQREDIVELLHDEGGPIDPEDRQLIQRVFAMTDLDVDRCMTPLVDVHAIPLTATARQAVEAVVRHGYSRLPVYRDRVDNIVGVLHHRDLLFGPADDEPIGALVTPVRFVPDSKKADELLREMRQQNDPFAVVVDEYGGSVGVVSIEDVLEELFGDILDERDKAPPGIRRVGEREWRVPARTSIPALEEAIGRPVPDGDYETVAGLILATTGRIPTTGEVLRLDGLTLHVEAATDRAVRVVRVVI